MLYEMLFLLTYQIFIIAFDIQKEAWFFTLCPFELFILIAGRPDMINANAN